MSEIIMHDSVEATEYFFLIFCVFFSFFFFFFASVKE